MARREGRRGHVLNEEMAVQRESPCSGQDNCRAAAKPTEGDGQNRRLEEAFQQLGREAGGAYDIGILRVGPSLSCREQLLLTQWSFDVAKQMAKGGPSALCLVCDTEFPPEHPDAFLVNHGAPSRSLGRDVVADLRTLRHEIRCRVGGYLR